MCRKFFNKVGCLFKETSIFVLVSWQVVWGLASGDTFLLHLQSSKRVGYVQLFLHRYIKILVMIGCMVFIKYLEETSL